MPTLSSLQTTDLSSILTQLSDARKNADEIKSQLKDLKQESPTKNAVISSIGAGILMSLTSIPSLLQITSNPSLDSALLGATLGGVVYVISGVLKNRKKSSLKSSQLNVNQKIRQLENEERTAATPPPHEPHATGTPTTRNLLGTASEWCSAAVGFGLLAAAAYTLVEKSKSPAAPAAGAAADATGTAPAAGAAGDIAE